MVTFCEMKLTSKPLLFLIKNMCMTGLKSNWLVMCEVGNAVCVGVVNSSSAEILRDLMCFISVNFL